MRRFVFDEWLWADLSGENNQKAQGEAFQLLQGVFERCDRLVTVEGSQFLRKFYKLARGVSTGDPRRGIVKVFKAEFFENSEKLYRLQQGDLPGIDEEIERNVKDDDKYLVQAYLASEAEVLVTTDNSLMEVLPRYNINCRNREEFLSGYLWEHKHK